MSDESCSDPGIAEPELSAFIALKSRCCDKYSYADCIYKSVIFEIYRYMIFYKINHLYDCRFIYNQMSISN